MKKRFWVCLAAAGCLVFVSTPSLASSGLVELNPDDVGGSGLGGVTAPPTSPSTGEGDPGWGSLTPPATSPSPTPSPTPTPPVVTAPTPSPTPTPPVVTAPTPSPTPTPPGFDENTPPDFEEVFNPGDGDKPPARVPEPGSVLAVLGLGAFVAGVKKRKLA